MISGFCSETEAEHEETLSLMDIVQYDYAYMFAYSERPGTPAAKKYTDDVANDIKTRRLDEIITKQRNHSLVRYKQDVGTLQRVLIEGQSRRSEGHCKAAHRQTGCGV
jgi:tRNA-2-methylthio-N6-dimethylallyladenosine synthase